MSYSEWEEKSLNFLTKMAKNPAVQSTWDKYDVNDESGEHVLRADIKRALFADQEIFHVNDNKLIRHIANQCIIRSEFKGVTDIAIIYVCVQVETPTSEHIVPIFRVRNCSKNPEACNVIDHLGNFYANFERYLGNNTWYRSRIMIPSQAQYKLNKNGECHVLIHDQISRVAVKTNLNIVENQINATTSIELSEEKIVNSITLMRQVLNDQTTDHRNRLNPEHHEKFEALREGHHATVQPGEIRELHGDRKFNESMSSIDDLNKYFDNLSITTDGNFQINDELTMHPRAFVQLPEKAVKTILEASKQVKDREITHEVFLKRIQHIRKDYRFKLDKERSDYVKYLTDKFEVNNLKDVRVGGEPILGNLKPNEIDRLHQVTKDSFCADTNYVRLGIDFSNKAEATNFIEFCAASEYVVRKVQAEIIVRKRANRSCEDRGKRKLKDFYRDQIIDEFRAEDFSSIVKIFQDLRNVCDIAIKDVDPRFKNSFAAANHYDKHKMLPKVDADNYLSPETYFNIACDMTCTSYSEVLWTQDGSSLCCIYRSETHGAQAIKFVSLPDKTGVIATLFDNRKDNKIIAARYYYHLDY